MDTWANNWVESYLDALLTYGLSTEHAGRINKVRDEVDADKNVHATYYLQQIMGLDEGGLWEAWSKASSAKVHGSKDMRLQYLSWRVWGMKQRNVRVRNEEKRRLLEEQTDAVVLDASEVSDDEVTEVLVERFNEPVPSVPAKHKVGASVDDSSLDLARLRMTEEPVDVSDAFEQRLDKLYVVLISMHGLVRGDKMELGKDPDTGGQVKYVVELARALSEHPAVHRVDLLTRMIKSPDVDKDYGVPEECIKPGEGKAGGAFIVRLPCGPVEKYIRKEELWPHVREFADNGITHVRQQMNNMMELGEHCELYNIHGHYADAGEVATLMAQTIGVDMVLTGHSLGRNKLEHLIASSTLSLAAVERTYNISRRIEGEERALDEAIMVFTSTQQEINEQWGLYNGYDTRLEEICRRRKGPYHVPAMRVIPPGLDFSSLKVDLKSETVAGEGPEFDAPTERVEPSIWKEIARFLQNPRKPVILAMSRPDAKKNITALVKAFGGNSVLNELANLVLIMGNRDVIDSMAGGSRNVLEQVLKLIDSYDLYGKVAYPKKHKQTDVSDIYHLPTATRGVFVNVALQEPFGLTLIEAGAHGVPIVATKNGGPVDIINTLQNGILVDPTDTEQIANALLTILTQKSVWDDYNKNGINNIMAYSWPAHCAKYLENIEREKKRRKNIKQITAFSGSWDNSKFNTMVDKAGFDMEDPMALVGNETPKMVDDSILDFEKEGRMAEEEKDSGAPRMANRERIYVFTLDNQPMAKQALKLLRGAVKAAYETEGSDRETSPAGFGIASMMSFDMTCTLLDYESVDTRDIDFIIVNGGADVFLWAGQDDMISYDPYDMHISGYWDKTVVERLLKRIWKDGKKEKRLLKHIHKKTGFGMMTDTGPNHILMEIEKEAKQSVDDVAVVDRIRAQLRNNGVRAQTVLQVDKTSAGKQVAPLLHVIPLRASRALAMRFLFHRLNIELDNVVVVCVASSVASTESKPVAESESRKVGFVVSDMYDIVGGKQKVIIVPPTDETRVRVPTDRLDAQMIEKLKLQCGPDVYDYRVVLLQEAKTKFAQIAEYLTV
ncbi:hypothetical protein BSKO_01603 [Bryopsis sp. KO-2023]|nr:hypothetical protein BSKO_01603 [Bryopsis sp. KO-2023]